MSRELTSLSPPTVDAHNSTIVSETPRPRLRLRDSRYIPTSGPQNAEGRSHRLRLPVLSCGPPPLDSQPPQRSERLPEGLNRLRVRRVEQLVQTSFAGQA